MLSRADVRRTVETMLRVTSIGLLAWMLWLSLERGRADTSASASSSNLSAALHDWSVAATPPDRIDVTLDSSPSPVQRDWLAALEAAGSDVSWNGEISALALDVERIRSPRGGFVVSAAAPQRATVYLEDEVGPLDTATALNGGTRFSVPAAMGRMKLTSGATAAYAQLEDSVTLKRLLVLGTAGWESKFVVAALEEDGWKVDAEMRVAPGVSVTQGSIGAIDTARYSAVIAVDAAAASRAASIVRFVTSGGGLILGGAASALDAFAPLRAGNPGRLQPAPVLASAPGAITLRSLAVTPVSGLRGDAVVLDRRDGAISAAARRHLGGRVLQHGYTDTWRWRMSGGDASVDQHRAWWTRAVASVAYAPRVDLSTDDNVDNAPVAQLISALGPSSPPVASSLAHAAGSVSLWLLFALLSFSLLAEWASRRLRGSR